MSETQAEEPFIILLIEDEDAHVGLIKRAFEKARVVNNIVVVSDGEEALDYLFRRGRYIDPVLSPSPGLIILDLKLPKVDGFEVLQSIKEDPTLQVIPVVVLTTSEYIADVQRAYEYGANSYVTKPIEFNDFQAKVSDLGLYWILTNTPPSLNPKTTKKD